ncbi:sensor histidine kinase [Goodfellowiella coeruleoviolacea]|uniref:sensor histidine kinase n=1 Tax=Goodfellowiella coeruleoviolacea TaxID=334858 RepID=UPI0020A4A223|nr:histidine kinase [Goodfellowiella coeruleoviolacea]
MLTGPVLDRLRGATASLTRPAGPLPRPTRANWAFDVALALVLAAVMTEYAVSVAGNPVSTGLPGGGSAPQPAAPPDWPATVLPAFTAAAALAFRRRYPLAVLWTVLGVTLLAPPDLPRLTFYACVIAAYSAAAYSPHRLPVLAGLLAAVLWVGTVRDSVLPVVPNTYAPLLILVPIVVAAHGLRGWKLRTDEGRVRVSTLEREQAEALRRAIEHERARIARELHDVVTHNVSVMVIQAGAARKVLASAPDQAREALLAIEAGGRAAMTELRHVMGLLTMDSHPDPAADQAADLAPQPTLDQVAALVARVRDAGLAVTLTVTGHPRPLPSGIELAAYRVVQEALTNTVKHAAGAAASVTVDYAPDLLRVAVTDTGGHPAAEATGGNGRGLIGLHERLGVYGGTLHAGPGAAGGFQVTARIPVEAA